MNAIDDFELERICDRSADFCGCNCMACEAFAANKRYHDGYNEEDDEGDDEENYEE